MSWFSKVVWSEGLFLRPHHFQQNVRYGERYVENRVRYASPYPWGFYDLELDRDLAQQNKFGLRRASGVMPDGTPFSVPADSPLPPPVVVPESAAGLFVWLVMPEQQANTREVDGVDGDSGSRYYLGSETFIDSTSQLRIEEEVETAHPRLSFEIRKTARPGFTGMVIARLVEVTDKAIVFDERHAPPMLSTNAHPVVAGWLDRVIGWVETKLEELARYASDPGVGGGLQSVDYFMLQMLNRNIPVLKHLRASRYVHPERLYIEFLRLVGELSTYATRERRARDYPNYDHDNLEMTFAPVLSDIQRYLNIDISRALRLDIEDRGNNSFRALIRDRNLFRAATFILEVEAKLPLTEIQSQFPKLFKLGPSNRMQEIVYAHLPGINLVHLPTPPGQIRAISTHVYFYLDRQSPLWPEFSIAPAIGMHFSGDWPGLELTLWAIKEESR